MLKSFVKEEARAKRQTALQSGNGAKAVSLTLLIWEAGERSP